MLKSIYLGCMWVLIGTLYPVTFDIVITSYNNARYVKKNLNSVRMQTHSDYHIYYIDDCSSDDTLQLVYNYVEEYQMHDKITIISNTQRMYKLYNLYTIIHTYIPDDHVVIELDGDDWLLSPSVCDYLAYVYEYTSVWMTYGGFIAAPIEPPCMIIESLHPLTIAHNEFRNIYHQNPIFMALRSYYAGLFKKIKKEDLQEHGLFFSTCSDVATMIPMFEMAGDRFHRIMNNVYHYNTDTGNNEYITNPSAQHRVYNMIRYKRKYKKLSHATW